MHYCVKQNCTEKHDTEQCIPTMKGCMKRLKCNTGQSPIHPPTIMKKYMEQISYLIDDK